MADGSKIEWTDATWTPIRARHRKTGKVGWFCIHHSPGCLNCYAEAMNLRLGNGVRFRAQDLAEVEIFLDEKMLLAPLHWRKPRHIFVCSMTDLFAEFVTDAMLDRVFAAMALSPQHTFQVLTKRAKRMRAYVSDRAAPGRIYDLVCDMAVDGTAKVVLIAPGVDAAAAPAGAKVFLGAWPLPNVWSGTSAEDQPRLDERIDDLLATPAPVRFISGEPLLGRIKVPLRWRPGIDWVIVGGESGPNARPMHPDWVRSLRDQCAAAGVPFYFKQWGGWAPSDDLSVETVWRREQATVLLDGRVREWEPGFPEARLTDPKMRGMTRLGKKAAGALLDGRAHLEFPEP